MQDRVPLYAGRVQLTPVSGNIYDMSMADQPQAQGTPLNKATFLKDATAALFGLPNTAVPDDVLAMLPNMINGKAKIETGSYVGTGTYGSGNPVVLSIGFTPKFIFISSYGFPDFAVWCGGTRMRKFSDAGSYAFINNITIANNAASFWTSETGGAGGPRNQMNASSNYYWVAIG